MNKAKVGIIGCGAIATKWHIPCFQKQEKAVVAAVCDISPQLAESTAKKFGVEKSYSNIELMLNNEGLDIVDICTPPQTHAPIAIQAMEKHCNVLLEKPMALKLSECDEMARVSNKNNVKLCIIHNELFRPPMIKARSMVKDGEIGKVLGMQWTRFTHREEYFAKENHWIHKLPGGIIGETGPHGVYTSLAFLNKVDNGEIAAKNNLKYSWAPFDYFNITLEGQEILSNIILSHASDNYVADVAIFGTEGIIKLDMQSMILTHYTTRNAKPKTLAASALGVSGQTIGGVMSNASRILFSRNPMMSVTGHGTEIALFVESVVNDTQSPVTAEEGREVIKVMEMIVQKLHKKYADVYAESTPLKREG